MHLTRLSLTDFRSYRSALIEPGPGFVLLSGDNGAGKTNILEAVSLLTPGRGLRGAALGEMACKDGPGGFGVAATLLPSGEREGSIAIGTGTLATAPDRRQVRINGAPAAVNSLSEWLSVLWLTPAMDRLFADSAGARRRFLDRLVMALEPAHAHHPRARAAIRARKIACRSRRRDPAWLAASRGECRAWRGGWRRRTRTVATLEERLAAAPPSEFASAKVGSKAGRRDSQRAEGQPGRDAAAGRATVARTART